MVCAGDGRIFIKLCKNVFVIGKDLRIAIAIIATCEWFTLVLFQGLKGESGGSVMKWGIVADFVDLSEGLMLIYCLDFW